MTAPTKSLPALPPSSQIAERLAAYSDAAEGAYAANTTRAIRLDLDLFARFCRERGVESLPASPATVVGWIDDHAARGLKVTTVRRRVSSIAHVHRAAGLPDPTKDDLVRLRLRALARQVGVRPRQARPLLWEDVVLMLRCLPETRAGLRDRALILVARDLLARRSELVALDVEDIEAAADGSGLAFIRRSKADQDGEGARRYLGPSTMEAIARWREAAGIRSGALFRRVGRGDRVRADRLGDGSVSMIFCRAAERAGLSSDGISGHSARVGGAVDLAAFGATLPELMSVGRWKSASVVARYTEQVAERASPVARFHAARGAA